MIEQQDYLKKVGADNKEIFENGLICFSPGEFAKIIPEMALTKKEQREIEKLVRRAQNDDAEAFGRLYDRFVVPIYRYIYYRVSRDEAEDLAENVFLRAWEKRVSYSKKSGSTFGSWLFRIAHNLVVDHYRVNSKTQTVELSDEMPLASGAPGPAEKLENKFERIELVRALRHLPEIQQQVLVLKFVNDLDNSEIAAIVEKSVGAVRVIQFRALNRLKILLDKNSNAGADFAFQTTENV